MHLHIKYFLKRTRSTGIQLVWTSLVYVLCQPGQPGHSQGQIDLGSLNRGNSVRFHPCRELPPSILPSPRSLWRCAETPMTFGPSWKWGRMAETRGLMLRVGGSFRDGENLGPVWIEATSCPANYLALTADAGGRLDGSQDSLALPIFWLALQISSPAAGETRAMESSAKKLARPRIGRVHLGVIQTGPLSYWPHDFLC
jgi:hypothetical protein